MAKDEKVVKRVSPPTNVKGRAIDDFCRVHKLDPGAVGMREKIQLGQKGYLVRSSRYKGTPWVIPTEYEGKALKLVKGGFFSRLLGGGKKAPKEAYKTPIKQAAVSKSEAIAANGKSTPLESRVTPKSTPAVEPAGGQVPHITGQLTGQRYSGEDAGQAGPGPEPVQPVPPTGSGGTTPLAWQVPGGSGSAPSYQQSKVCTYRTHPELAKVTEADFRVDGDGMVTGKDTLDNLARLYKTEPESKVLENLTSRDLFQGMPPEVLVNARVLVKEAIDYINDFGNKYAFKYSGPSLEELSAEADQAASGADVTNDRASPGVRTLMDDAAGLPASGEQTERYIKFNDEMERVFAPVLGRGPAKRRITEIMDLYIANKGWKETPDGISVDHNVTPKVLSKILGMDTTQVMRRLKKLGMY